MRLAIALLAALPLAAQYPVPGGGSGGAAAGGGPAGATGAVQAAGGGGTFADSGCTATTGSMSCTKYASTGSGAGGLSTLIANAGATGTTAKLLSKINSSGAAVIATTADTAIPVFITLATDATLGCTAGTTGNACLVAAGQGSCTADSGGITAAHFVVASTATNGRCMDGGATSPTASYSVGVATATCAGNADCIVQIAAGSGGAAGATGPTGPTGPTGANGTNGASGAGATLFSTTGSTTVTAASATTLIGTATGSTTIAANTFTAGALFQVLAQGFYTSTGSRTLTLTLKIGGSTQLTSGAITAPAATLGTWRLACAVTTRTAGVSGTQIGNCLLEMTGATLTAGADAPMQTSSTWTVDTTGTLAVDIQAAWDATTGAPTITSSNVAGWIPGAPVSSVFGQTGVVAAPAALGSSTATTQAVDDNSTKVATTAYVDRMKTRGIPFTIGDPAGAALTVAATTTDYVTVPFACTISAYNLVINTGTITVKFWKIATGTAIPTSSNSISTSGVSIASGTAIHSATVSDFTSTTVTANDILAMNVTAVNGAGYVQGVLACDQ